MFKKILVPLDGSTRAETALPVALEHAEVRDAGQVHHRGELEHADLELGDEIGAAGEHFYVGTAPLQGAQTIIEGGGSDELESTHAKSLRSLGVR